MKHRFASGESKKTHHIINFKNKWSKLKGKQTLTQLANRKMCQQEKYFIRKEMVQVSGWINILFFSHTESVLLFWPDLFFSLLSSAQWSFPSFSSFSLFKADMMMLPWWLYTDALNTTKETENWYKSFAKSRGNVNLRRREYLKSVYFTDISFPSFSIQ